MNKTIYVPDEAIWQEVEAKAKETGLSVSELLLRSFRKDSQLDRIEGSLSELSCTAGELFKYVSGFSVPPQHVPLVPVFKPKPFEPVPDPLAMPKAQGWSTPFNPMSKERQSKGSNIKEKQIGN